MEKKKTVVVALGHRALGSTLPEQKTATREAAKAIADLIEMNCNVVVTHGNTPQIAMIHMAMSEFAKNHPEFTNCPMSVCSAMSQGYIGYDLQNSIRAELLTRGIDKPVATVLTQVLVDAYDEAFYNPTKVIGRVLTREEADEEEKKGNFVTPSENGYRRIVASPQPRDVIETKTIKALLRDEQVVICCGGGGIPVMEQGIDRRPAVSGFLDAVILLAAAFHALHDLLFKFTRAFRRLIVFLYVLNDVRDLIIRNERSLDTRGFRQALGEEQHIALPQQFFRSSHIQYGTGIG